MKWEIANAHKGGTTAIYVDNLIVITGGKDCVVRVWTRANR